MGLCCGITALVICIYIGYVISCSEKEKQEKNRREEENKRSRSATLRCAVKLR